MEEKALVFRSLRKRKEDSKGRPKHPQYRTVPVPKNIVKDLDFVFGIRKIQKQGKKLDDPLWSMSRPTAYRLVKRVMDRAGINAKQATGKGLRHGFGVVMRMPGKVNNGLRVAGCGLRIAHLFVRLRIINDKKLQA